MYALVDAKICYAFKLETYPGTQPPGLYSCNHKLDDSVNSLVALTPHTIQNVTSDNWFSSCQLMPHLLTEKKLTSCTQEQNKNYK